MRLPRAVPVRGARLFLLGGALLTLVLLVVVGAVGWLTVRSMHPLGSRPLHGLPGAIEGKVWRVDPDTGVIHVSSRLFGLGATVLRVTDDTRVLIGVKEGGFGDMRPGMRVRAAYEVRQNGHLARSIEVLGESSTTAAPGAAPPRAADAPLPSAIQTRPEDTRATGVVPRLETAPTSSRGAGVRESARPPAPRAVPRPPTAAAASPRSGAAQPATSSDIQSVPGRSAQSDGPDPAGAIDWLLNEHSGRRP